MRVFEFGNGIPPADFWVGFNARNEKDGRPSFNRKWNDAAAAGGKKETAAAFSREKRRERGADGFGEWDGCVGIGRNCGEGRFGKNLGKNSLGMGANFVVDNLGRVTQSG